jgi:tight adherence protein B
MTGWLAWSAVAAGLLVLPVRSPALARLHSLSAADRVARAAVPPRRLARRPAVPTPVLMSAGCGVVVLTVLVLGGPALALAAAALLGLGGLLGRDVVRRRAHDARQRDLLAGVQALVAEFESGAGPPAALEAAAAAGARVRAEFAAAGAVAVRGGAVADLLCGCDDDALQAVGQAWRLGDDTGAPLAGVLGRVAADLAAAQEQRRTVSVALAGPRSSAAVLSGLPILGIALGAAMGARPLPFLVGTAPGRLLCCVGVLLDVAGVLWMRRILRSAERSA